MDDRVGSLSWLWDSASTHSYTAAGQSSSILDSLSLDSIKLNNVILESVETTSSASFKPDRNYEYYTNVFQYDTTLTNTEESKSVKLNKMPYNTTNLDSTLWYFTFGQ